MMSKYRRCLCFPLGFVPSGGRGFSSSCQEEHTLCWKRVLLVLWKAPELLTSMFSPERSCIIPGGSPTQCPLQQPLSMLPRSVWAQE